MPVRFLAQLYEAELLKLSGEPLRIGYLLIPVVHSFLDAGKRSHELYQTGTQETAAHAGGGSSDEDVVDADFNEVDEDKK